MRKVALALVLVAGCGGNGGTANGGGGGSAGGGGSGGGGGGSGAVGTVGSTDPCHFAAGSLTKDTLLNLPAKNPIEHIIVVMKENRSYDEILGALHDQGQPDSEAVPAGFANGDANGMSVARFHNANSCYPVDPDHQWADVHAQIDSGKMDGFVTNAAKNNVPYKWPTGMTPDPLDGHFTMGYFDSTDLPYYYWLANTFAVADHHFASVAGGTWANRDYLVAGTSNGTKDTETDPQLAYTVPIIFPALTKANVSWQVYTDDFEPLEFSVDWANRSDVKMWGSVSDFFSALSAGTLPAVTFVDATTGLNGSQEQDEHPPADVQYGEQWTATLINNVIASPTWSTTALFFTYDEAGGHADHVAPPTGRCAPDDQPQNADFTELGIRVPMILVSPYAKRHFVSHVQHEHTSILRFIEHTFGIGALTRRDANSDAMLDMFDFDTTPAAVPTNAPMATVGECTTPQ